MSRPATPTLVAVVLVCCLAVVGAAALVATLPGAGEDPMPDGPDERPTSTSTLDLVTADSEAAYRAYLREGQLRTDGFGVGGGGDGGIARMGGPDVVEVAVAEEAMTDDAVSATQASAGDGGDGASGAGGAAEPRHSETNVQVVGIDEPDLVKTDGEHLYYSGTRDRIARVVSALPPEEAQAVARLPESGQLLLVDDTLVVLGDRRVAGYDVADPEDPELTWEKRLESQVRTARLHDGTVYLVLVTGAHDCPVVPVEGTTVTCTDIHHPREPQPVQATYTMLTLDPTDGSVGDSFSFAGTHQATVYMSQNALYVTHTETRSWSEVQFDYLLGPGRDQLPDDVAARLETVQGYDLSPQAKQVEVQQTLERWFAGMTDTERHRVQSELADGFAGYVSDHKRDLTTTHVVRVPVGEGVDGDELGEPVVGAVPGQPLDQFSLDEHEGHLRIATTVGERWRFVARGTGDSAFTTENDVYVLDAETLEVTGAVTGMGETERIYGVRFQGDSGYVVTFRQIDPFHVLDLSDPSNPQLSGELKLPGYSSYLHPLGDDRVLGIGQEDGRVKLVVFDVSDPATPTIEKSRVLDARWSVISQSHHAFLFDPRHEVFFLPTATGGQVFETDLDRVARIDLENPQRAVYIGDHLYVLGTDELVVVDENEWEPVRRTPLS